MTDAPECRSALHRQIPVEKVVEKERVVEKMVPVPGPERVVVKEAPREREREVYREPPYRPPPEPRFVERTSPPPAQSTPSPPRSRTAVGVGLSLYRRENVSSAV